ncbi:hypothetical protein MDOR_16390 [Mycolicibacterium doricum]|uniref:Uncharacterized protein n=1 Tax=Mycolicibacterium doricum TaxID=126673 RepID=A0A7I7VR21_9MYCO|nr:hypothetical protein MDOR_16390 [Mycolicibacterium doricum]
MPGQRVTHTGGGDGPAAEREHPIVGLQRRADDLFLDATELLLTVGAEDVGDRASRDALDGGVGVEQRQPQRLGEATADGRLTRTGQADQYRPRRHQPDACAGCAVAGWRAATARR